MMNEHSIEIAWGDCDPAGIVFYPNYFKWMDHATWKLFEKKGLTLQVLQERFDVFGCPLVDASAKFMKPATLGDKIKIKSAIATWGTCSFHVTHEMYLYDVMIFSGKEVRVWASNHNGVLQKKLIPQEIRQLFTS